MSAAVSAAFTILAAAGDMVAVALALVAPVAVQSGWRAAPALVWLFTVERLADFINAIVRGLRLSIPAN